MAYGTIKVDTVTFTDGGIDKSVTLSGLVQNPTFSGNVTVTGTLSGVTVTGTTASFTSGVFANISGGTHTITSGVFAAGSAASPSISFTSDPNTGIYSPGADQIALSTNGTGRLFVDASGKVGVGTSSPATALHVSGSGTQRIRITGTGAANAILTLDAPSSYINYIEYGASASTPLAFYDVAAAAERLRITSTGLVGIGTSAPARLLSISDQDNATIRLTNTRLAAGQDQLFGAIEYEKSDGSGAGAGVVGGVRMRSGSSIASNAYMTFSTSSGSANDVERVRIDPLGNVGIGTTSPSSTLDVNGDCAVANTKAYQVKDSGGTTRYAMYMSGSLSPSAGNDLFIGNTLANSLVLYTNSAERARIDSSGRLLVGTSSSLQVSSVDNVIQVEGTHTVNGHAISAVRHGSTVAAAGSVLSLGRSRGTSVGSKTAVANGDTLGIILFAGANGTDFSNVAAWIRSEVDGDPFTAGDTADLPGRLVFSTTADGASSPTEQLRITSDRYVRLASGTGGIQFNGDTAAANALDDYEEGTFAPTITQGVTSPTYGGSNSGAYRIIGKQLFFSLRVQLTGGTADANPLIVGGLPIVALLGSIYLYPQVGRFQSGASNTGVIATGQASTNSLTIYDASDRTAVTGTEATNTLDLQITGSYPIG